MKLSHKLILALTCIGFHSIIFMGSSFNVTYSQLQNLDHLKPDNIPEFDFETIENNSQLANIQTPASLRVTLVHSISRSSSEESDRFSKTG